MSLAEEITKNKPSPVASLTGVFVEMVGGLARVNLQGATVDIRCDGWYQPIPGAPVRVQTVDSVMRVVGPAQALPARGEVLASLDGGVRGRVLVDGREYVLPVMAPYIPVVGDDAVINWPSGHILGEEASALEAPPPPVNTAPPSKFDGLLMYPTGSGKYDSNTVQWWGNSEPWASNNNRGIWVYGGRNGMLAGANVTKTEIFLPLLQSAGSCSIGLHGYSGIPSGFPTITDSVALPNRNGWVELPGWWGNHLRDNTDAGIGVFAPTGGNNRWRGAAQNDPGRDALSGVLRFAGER